MKLKLLCFDWDFPALRLWVSPLPRNPGCLYPGIAGFACRAIPCWTAGLGSPSSLWGTVTELPFSLCTLFYPVINPWHSPCLSCPRAVSLPAQGNSRGIPKARGCQDVKTMAPKGARSWGAWQRFSLLNPLLMPVCKHRNPCEEERGFLPGQPVLYLQRRFRELQL